MLRSDGVLVALGIWLGVWFLPALLWGVRRRRRARDRAAQDASHEDPTPAEIRARDLLRALVDIRDYDNLLLSGYLDVPSPGLEGRMYRVPLAPGRVRVFEHGQALMDLCVWPIDPLPIEDLVALHKLMIECNEPAYLAAANRFPVGEAPRYRRRGGMTRRSPWPFFGGRRSLPCSEEFPSIGA
jgi:hypothetical protein